MFNLFKNKKENNPISEIFSDLTTNQKMSIFNLLTTIASCDGDEGDFDIELKYLNVYVNILSVNGSRCTRYLESGGLITIINDLKNINRNQKEFLVVSAWEIIICDGRPNEKELDALGQLFNALGINENEIAEIVAKNQALTKNIK